MDKIQKLDDLKDFRGDLTLKPQQFLDVVREHVAPANYGAVLGLLNETEEEVVEVLRKFSRVEASTYANAVYQIIQGATENQPQFTLDDGAKVSRPLTFKENLVARLEDDSLFGVYLDSCTGIAYKKGTSLIKLNPETRELIMIPKGFNGRSINISYDEFEGEELDVARRSHQDKWLVAMGGDNSENRDLYQNHQQKLHEITGVDKNCLMRFYTIENPLKDQLNSLFVNDSVNNSNANGYDILYIFARFLRVN